MSSRSLTPFPLLTVPSKSTSNTIKKEERNTYWDGGPKKIQAFVDQHELACESNWVCRSLQLASAEVQVLHSESMGGPSELGQTQRHKLAYILA
jgi:hypothetical protein